MLSSIRKHARSWVVKALFGLLIAAFAIWGIGDVFRGAKTAKPILKIGKNFEYTQGDFDRELKLALQRVSQMQGVQVTPQMFAAFGGAQRLVDQAENKGLLQAYAEKLGIDMPQSAAIQAIQADPNFAGATGQFDRPRFEYFLRQMGQTEAQYVEMIRSQLRANEVLVAMLGVIHSPSPLVNSVYGYTQELRTASVLTIPNASITDAGTPDEAALKKWHEDHADRYKAPEYRAATLVQMAPADFVQDVSVSDDEIQQEYDSRQAEFTTPETRDVEQVVVQDQAVADKILADIKGGKAFADAVKAETQGDPVSLGQVTKDKLPADIADAVFALAADGVSDALKSPFGIHIAHVRAITPGSTKSLEDVKAELRNTLALGRAADAMESVREQLQDELAGGATLDDAAKKLQLHIQKIEAIDASGKDAAGTDLALSSDAVGLIFGTDAGDPSDITALNDGSYAVAQVTGVTAPAVKPLDQVKDQATQDWIAAQQSEKATEKAKALIEKLKGGGDLNAEATALGLTLKISKPFNRGDGDPENGVDPVLAQAIFKLKPQELTLGQSAEGPVVARLIEVTAAKPEEHADDLKQLEQRVSQSLGGDLQQAFYDALKAEIPVERNDAQWQSLIDQSDQ
ncbi:peptidyl-prolyl cis-trans isomerase [Dongia sp.]|uniref:peptidyl-prolyl cis-trans isomerase n=1 Tax=Dongia sp. TaxID=1977262 RepID=UPI0035ADB910